MRNNLRRVLSVAAWCLCCLRHCATCLCPHLPARTAGRRSDPTGPMSSPWPSTQRTPSTAFAGTLGSGVLKTVDGGANWSTANEGLPIPVVSALAIDPSDARHAVCRHRCGRIQEHRWRAELDARERRPGRRIAGHHQRPRHRSRFAGHRVRGHLRVVFKTTDGAANWTSINAGLVGLTPRIIAIDPASPSTLYVGVDDYAEVPRQWRLQEHRRRSKLGKDLHDTLSVHG